MTTMRFDPVRLLSGILFTVFLIKGSTLGMLIALAFAVFFKLEFRWTRS